MGKIVCRYYVTHTNRMPAEEFISGLDARSRRKFYYIIELLEEEGKSLSMPHAKYIGEDIFELRFSAEQGASRVLYFFFDNKDAILTNGFIKKSNKTPAREKIIAIERRKEYLCRNPKGDL